MNQFPLQAGTYSLLFALDGAKTLRIGKIGQYNFPAGVYVYCGSAKGHGGLRSRLGHHLKAEQRATPRWHIDWLLPEMNFLNYCFTTSDEHLECVWSQTLASLPEARLIVPRFGATDCTRGCPAHLILFLRGTLPGQIFSALQRVTTNVVEMR